MQLPDCELQVPLRLGRSRLHTRLVANSPRRVDARTGCEPFTRQVLPKGGVWPAGHGGLVRRSVAPPSAHRPLAYGHSAQMRPWYLGRTAHRT